MSTRKRPFSKAIARSPQANSTNSGGTNRRFQVKGRRTATKEARQVEDSTVQQFGWNAIPLPPPLPQLFNIELQNIVQGPEKSDLERIPGKIQTSNGKQSTNQSANGQNKSYATAVKSSDKEISAPVSEDEDPRLLLSQIYEKNSEANNEAQRTDSFEQSLFVRELIHSLPVENDSPMSAENRFVSPQPSAAHASAISIDCGKLSSSFNGAEAVAENGDRNQNDLTNIVNESDVFKSMDQVAHEYETDELDNDQQNNNGAMGLTLSKASSSDHDTREVNDTSLGIRRSNSEEKSQHSSAMTDLKKDPSNLRSASQYSSGASNVPGLVRSQSSHPVSSFRVLVSGTTEQ